MKKYNIKLYRGDDRHLKLNLKGSLNFENVKRIDLHFKNNEGEVIFELSTTNNLIQILKSDTLLIKFANSLTKDIEVVKGLYDLQLTFNDDIVRTIMRGSLEILSDVTKVN